MIFHTSSLHAIHARRRPLPPLPVGKIEIQGDRYIDTIQSSKERIGQSVRSVYKWREGAPKGSVSSLRQDVYPLDHSNSTLDQFLLLLSFFFCLYWLSGLSIGYHHSHWDDVITTSSLMATSSIYTTQIVYKQIIIRPFVFLRTLVFLHTLTYIHTKSIHTKSLSIDSKTMFSELVCTYLFCFFVSG